MKNGIDYIYEYSDLNFLQTRVEVLSGKYQGLIVEFGSSRLYEYNDVKDFTFDYTIYKEPPKYKLHKLLDNQKFEKYLSVLLTSILIDRKENPEIEKENITDALGHFRSKEPKINIDASFYPCKKKKNIIKEISIGTVDF